jgi:ABC-type transport system substrate-binding protein
VVAGVALVLVAVTAAGACTKKGGGGGSGSSEAADVFRAGIVRPATLDPAQARSVDELLVADQLFDTLAATDAESQDAVPALAASWTVSADQLQWDFTLRPDARFSDGAPVTAADVKATLDRIARKDSGSSVADLLEVVAGYRAAAVDGTATELAGVVATDERTVRIALESPWSVLPTVLANPAFGVLPAAVAEAPFPAGSAQLPTSGPYRIASVADARISLVPAPGVKAAAAGVDFVLFDDKAAAYDALVDGDVDWSEVPPDRAEDAAETFGRSHFRPYVAELFYAFNLRNPKFADGRFREAIVRAVDRDAIVRSVYGTAMRPNVGLVVEGLPGHQDDPCAGRCDHDADRARALLAEIVAGGGAVPEIAIDFEADDTQTEVATALREALAAVGITATLRPKPLEEYQRFAVSGEQELFRLGWVAPYASADGILTPLFLTGFPNNVTGFSSVAVDDVLRAARAEPDPAARVERWKAAERLVLAELPIIPIGQFELHSAAAERVRGLAITVTGTFDARTVSVAPAG